MNDYWIRLKPARTALILFALSLLIALTIIIGLVHYRSALESDITQTEQKLDSVRSNIKTLHYDLDSISRYATKYQQLTQLGFTSKPDRDAWIQHLDAIYRETGLPPTLRYTLAPPQLMEHGPHQENSPLAYRNHVLHHDLSIELSDIHEGELLKFFEKLNAEWQIPFRVESCQIVREEQATTAPHIKCTLKIFTLDAAADGMNPPQGTS